MTTIIPLLPWYYPGPMVHLLCDYHIQPDSSLKFRQREIDRRQTGTVGEEKDSISLRTLHGYALGNLINGQMHICGGKASADEFWTSFLSSFSSHSSCTHILLQSLKRIINKFFDNGGEKSKLGKKTLLLLQSLKRCINKYFDDEGERSEAGEIALTDPKLKVLWNLFNYPKIGLDKLIESIKQRVSTEKDILKMPEQWLSESTLDETARLLQLMRNFDKNLYARETEWNKSRL